MKLKRTSIAANQLGIFIVVMPCPWMPVFIFKNKTALKNGFKPHLKGKPTKPVFRKFN